MNRDTAHLLLQGQRGARLACAITEVAVDAQVLHGGREKETTITAQAYPWGGQDAMVDCWIVDDDTAGTLCELHWNPTREDWDRVYTDNVFELLMGQRG